MTTKIQTALRLALEAKRFTDLADIEVHRTRRGHWHPPDVPCTRRCPIGDPRTAVAFDRQLQRGVLGRLEDEDGNVTETFTLITTLLDPDTAPARELAELYKARWEIETALGSLKTQLKGSGVVLRSKTPDGVIQEIWALLCACQAVRDLTAAAAAHF